MNEWRSLCVVYNVRYVSHYCGGAAAAGRAGHRGRRGGGGGLRPPNDNKFREVLVPWKQLLRE